MRYKSVLRSENGVAKTMVRERSKFGRIGLAVFAFISIPVASWTEDVDLRISYMHVILSAAGKDVRVLEIGRILSRGREGNTVEFRAPLPAGYHSLDVLGADNLDADPEGFSTSIALTGEDDVQVTYSYSVAMESTGKLVFQMAYDTDTMEILYPGGSSITVESGALTSSDPISFGRQRFERLSGTAFKKDELVRLNIDFSGSEAALSGRYLSNGSPQFHNAGHVRIWKQSGLRNFNPHLFSLVMAALTIGALVVAAAKWTSNRRTATGYARDDRIFMQLVRKKSILISRIADIEERLSSGQMAESGQEERYEVLKRSLIETEMILEDMTETESSG